MFSGLWSSATLIPYFFNSSPVLPEFKIWLFFLTVLNTRAVNDGKATVLSYEFLNSACSRANFYC